MQRLVPLIVSLLGMTLGAADAEQSSGEPRRDVLILRGSGLQEGVLQGCMATCSLGGQPHPRAEILLIGLQVAASAMPPAIDDPFQDAVYLRNANVVKSKLVGIDAQQVVTEQGAHPRAGVAWVFLALPPPTPDPRGASSPTSARQSGALWTGQVHWTHKPFWGHLVTTSAEVRLREVPLSVPAGSFVRGMVEYIELRHEGSQVHRTHADILGGNNCAIRGQGSASATGPSGQIQRLLEEVGPHRQPRWSAWTYGLSVGPAREPVWTETCPQGSWTHGGGAGGWNANIGSGGDDPRAERTLDGGRMAGAFVNRDGTFVSWSICREGVACPGR